MNCVLGLLRNASITISFCALFFAACSRAGGPQAQHGNPWTVHGVLRIAGRQTPDNLNPLLGTQTVDTDLSMFWAGYLFNWSDRDELVPELAVRVPTQENGDISADGRRITYHLRRGVRWQDGAPFTADDVIYTWRQLLNPRNLVVSRLGYDIVARIDERDPYTIDVHLKKPFAPFVSTFFSMANHSDCILPRHLLARYPDLNRVAFNSLPVGTGPFRVERYDKGSGITFVANPLYWRGAPALRRIEFRIIESDNTMLTLLQTHAIDVYYRAAESALPSLVNVPGTRVVISPFTRFADLGLNAGNVALADVRVRRALAYAIDRTALVRKVTHNVSVVGTTDQPDFLWAHNPNVQHYPFDPQKAAQLLDAAGWHGTGVRTKNGQPLRLQLVSFTGSSTASGTEVFIQEAWRRAGIDVEIKNFSSAQLYATLGAGGIEQSGKFDVAFENWANGTDPDDSILVRCNMAPPTGWNIYHFCNKDLDMAEEVALTSYDRKIRKRMYDRIQRIMAEQLPMIVLWYQRQLDVVNTDLRNYRPAHAVTPFWNTWQWSI